MTIMGVLGWVLVGLMTAFVLLFLVVNLRARHLNRAVGSFYAELQIGGDGKWCAGIGQYGAATLLWYKLASVSPAPVMALPRYELELSSARPHGSEPDMVEVTIMARGESWNVAMDSFTYNGLVSWVESGAPHSTQF